MNPPARGSDRYVRVEATIVYLVGPIKHDVTLEEALPEVKEILAEVSNRDDIQGVRHLEVKAPDGGTLYTFADAWGNPVGTEY